MRCKTILILRPGALGDALLALPALRALRAHFSHAQLHLVGHPGAGAVLRAAREVDGFTDFDAPEVAALFSPGAALGALEELAPLEVAVAWMADPEGVVEAQLRRLGAERVVVAPSRPPASHGSHVADHLLATLAPWAVPVPDGGAPLSMPFQPRVGWRQPAVLMHPGSGSAAKNWPPESFACVLDQLGQPPALPVVVISGPSDEAACVSVLRHAACRPPVQRPASVLELAALLAGSRAYLGNDSGVTHLAAVLGVPTLALFGPTDPRAWGPRGPCVQILPFSTPPHEVARAVREAVDGQYT